MADKGIEEYFSGLCKALSALPLNELEHVGELFLDCYDCGSTVFLLGKEQPSSLLEEGNKGFS